MNLEQLKKNIGFHVQIQPIAYRFDAKGGLLGSENDDWAIVRVEKTIIEIKNCRTDHLVKLGSDHVRNFSTNPNRSSGGIQYGFLVLHVQIYLQGVQAWYVPNSAPGEPGPLPRLPMGRIEKWLARHFHKYNFSETVKPWVVLGILIITAIGIFGLFQVVTATVAHRGHIANSAGIPNSSQVAEIQVQDARIEVYQNDLTRQSWRVGHFPIQIRNLTESTLVVQYWKLTDVRRLEDGAFVPWGEIDSLMLAWPRTVPRIIAAGDQVSVPFARIAPPEVQKLFREDRLLSGDSNVPQLRFMIVDGGWSRRMTSHIPPGTYRLRITSFFERGSPAEAYLEIEWPGDESQNVESMTRKVKVRRLNGDEA